MPDEPVIVISPPLRTAVVPLRVPRTELASVVGAAARDVLAVLAAQGVPARGPLLAYHRHRDDAVFDFEFGVPVDVVITPAGRVRPGVLPGGRVVRVVHHGPYEGLAAAWSGLRAWAADNAPALAGDFWARYVRGPETDADPATWMTELNLRLPG